MPGILPVWYIVPGILPVWYVMPVPPSSGTPSSLVHSAGVSSQSSTWCRLDFAAGLGFREALHAYSYRAPTSAAAVRVRELYVVAPGTEAWRAHARVTMGM